MPNQDPKKEFGGAPCPQIVFHAKPEKSFFFFLPNQDQKKSFFWGGALPQKKVLFFYQIKKKKQKKNWGVGKKNKNLMGKKLGTATTRRVPSRGSVFAPLGTPPDVPTCLQPPPLVSARTAPENVHAKQGVRGTQALCGPDRGGRWRHVWTSGGVPRGAKTDPLLGTRRVVAVPNFFPHKVFFFPTPPRKKFFLFFFGLGLVKKNLGGSAPPQKKVFFGFVFGLGLAKKNFFRGGCAPPPPPRDTPERSGASPGRGAHPPQKKVFFFFVGLGLAWKKILGAGGPPRILFWGLDLALNKNILAPQPPRGDTPERSGVSPGEGAHLPRKR